MEFTKICRICLVTNVKMYNMQSLSKLTTFWELTGISDVGKYSFICYECLARLRKCEIFRSNCLRAHEILTHTVTTNQQRLTSSLKLTALHFIECIHKIPSDQLDTFHEETKIEIINEEFNNQDVTNKCKKSYEKYDNALDKTSEYDIEGAFKYNNTIKYIEQHNIQDVIKYEYGDIVEQFATTDDAISTDSIVYCNSPDIAIELNIQDVPLKKKEKKVVRKNKKVCPDTFHDVDDEPLSNIQVQRKKNMAKNNITENKRPKFDAKSFEEFATVTIMTIEEAKEEVELRKESSNFKDCPLKCKFCYRGYESQKTFSNHMKKHTMAYGKYECDICHLRFPKGYLCTKHIYNCHTRKFSCKICPYISFGTSQAMLHINLHKGVKYTCEMCQNTFSMPNTLLMHKRIKHPTEVVCALCGSTFAGKRGVQSHNRLIHNQEKNDKKGPQCAECDVHFATELAWKRHLVLSSKHEVSNGCETCGETFASDDILKCHLRTHARIQRPRLKPLILPAACTICKTMITDSSEHKKHMASEHPGCDVTQQFHNSDRSCVCEFCGKRFKNHCFMKYHQRMHTGERPYKCNVCEKTFAFPTTLSVHKKTHTSDCNVKCDLCDRVFKCKNALNKHIKINHLNIRPHSCDVCGKSFHNQCEVKYHKQHVHSKVPWPKRDRSKRKKAKAEQTYLIT